jgi:hypothetical protein
MTGRVPDWENALSRYLLRVRDRPHKYGEHDCMLFVAGAVKALTGRDPAKGHRRKYRSEKTAASYLLKLGFKTPAAMVNAHLKPKSLAFAQRGDVVADREGTPGICMGDFAFFVGRAGEQEGLVRKPLSDLKKAWAVE